MIEGWELISSYITNEQLEILKHGCDLLKETYQEVETTRNTARSTTPEIEDAQDYNLRGQRVYYDGSTAKTDQKRKRRRTVERPSVETATFISQGQGANDMLGSPESIEVSRNDEQEKSQDEDEGPLLHDQLHVQQTIIPSPATSIALDADTVEQGTLFVPEYGDAYELEHIEAEDHLQMTPDRSLDIRAKPGELWHQSGFAINDNSQALTKSCSNEIPAKSSNYAVEFEFVPLQAGGEADI